MPRVSNELNSQYWEPVATGPVAQADLTALAAVPATIAASSNYLTGVLYADGHKVISAGVTLSQAGTIAIQRYLDTAGLVPQGAAISATLVAGTANVVIANDGAPFQSFTLKISNSGASTANVTNFALLLNAA